jgi:tryptophan-rich sensory protein
VTEQAGIPQPLAKPMIAFVALCLAVGWLSGLVTETRIATWYPTLVKPSWTPPNLAFPVVWTLLYIMMGIAAALVWRRSGAGQRAAPIAAFGVQLALNCLWTLLFFGVQNPFYGLIDIVLLLLAIVATIALFRRVSRAAALLLVPYFLWVAYAAALNARIWSLN